LITRKRHKRTHEYTIAQMCMDITTPTIQMNTYLANY
jgi:hypothetical protein